MMLLGRENTRPKMHLAAVHTKDAIMTSKMTMLIALLFKMDPRHGVLV